MPGLTSGISADSPSGDAEGDSYSRIGFQTCLSDFAMTRPPTTGRQSSCCPANLRQEGGSHG